MAQHNPHIFQIQLINFQINFHFKPTSLGRRRTAFVPASCPLNDLRNLDQRPPRIPPPDLAVGVDDAVRGPVLGRGGGAGWRAEEDPVRLDPGRRAPHPDRLQVPLGPV